SGEVDISLDRADDAAGVPGGKHPSWDVAGDDAAGADHAAGADGDAGTDDRTAAHPGVAADRHRLAKLLRPPQLCIHGMRRGVDLHRWAEEAEVSDAHLTDIEDDAV